jgi:hypothetical protein
MRVESAQRGSFFSGYYAFLWNRGIFNVCGGRGLGMTGRE